MSAKETVQGWVIYGLCVALAIMIGLFAWFVDLHDTGDEA